MDKQNKCQKRFRSIDTDNLSLRNILIKYRRYIAFAEKYKNGIH